MPESRAVETRYATTFDGVSIAYQVVGDGEPDIIVVVSAFLSNVELGWEFAPTRALADGLAARGRLIIFDRRGTGLSDGVNGDRLPTLEARMEDIRTVLDAAGSERAVLFGLEDGAAQALLFAATYPERTRALITMGASAGGFWTPEEPWRWTHEMWDEELTLIREQWGSVAFAQALANETFPDRAHDPEFVRSYGRLLRHSMRKADAIAVEQMYRDTDVAGILPTIQVPTLVMNMAEDLVESVEEGRYMAAQIPGAQFVELPGRNHGQFDAGLPYVDQFLNDLRTDDEVFERVLSTVLFTDIVGSTETVAGMGDRRWTQLLERHNQTTRALLVRFRGEPVASTGDGYLALFDGPGRAIRCAHTLSSALEPLGIRIRAGLHTGEIERVGDNVGGLAVHIGARVLHVAQAGDVVVSSTVRDLVAGSGLTFEDVGSHAFKGLAEEWRLYRAVRPVTPV